MKGDLVTRLLLETQQFDDNLAKATKSVRGFSQQGQGLSSVLGGLKGVVGKLAIGIGAATSATEVFNKTIASSQTLTDNFAIITEQATSVVDSFFNSLATGDFSGFLSGLSNVIDAAREASIALDDLATHQIFNNPKYAKFDLRQAEITRTLRNPKSTEAQKAQARRDQDQLNKERTKAAQDDANAYSRAFIATFNKNLAKNGASKRWAKALISDIQNQGEDYYKWNAAQLKKVEKELAKETTVVKTTDPYYGVNQTSYIYSKRGKQLLEEVRARRALAETSDEDLQTSMQFAAEAYRSQAKAINQETAGYRAYYKGLTGGGRSRTGGRSKSDREQDKRTELQKIIDEINQLVADRDYKIQLGINTDQAKKEIDKLKKDIKNKQTDFLTIGYNLLTYGSPSQIQDFINQMIKQRDNSTTDEEYKSWDIAIQKFQNSLDRFTGKLSQVIPQLSQFNGQAKGGAEDISLFRERLRDLRKTWDETNKQLIEATSKGVLQSDLDYEALKERKQLLRESEYDALFQKYLDSIDRETYYKYLTGRELYVEGVDKKTIDRLESLKNDLADGMQQLEKAILYLATRGLAGSTNWYERYRLSPSEQVEQQHIRNIEELTNISQAFNQALLDLDEQGKVKPFTLKLTVPADVKEDLAKNLSNPDKSFFAQFFKQKELDQFSNQLKQSLENAYSDANISINIDRTKEELTNAIKFITPTLSAEQFTLVLTRITEDIKNYKNQINSLRFDLFVDGANAVSNLGDSFESLNSVLDSNASIFKKVSTTISTLIGVFTSIQRIVETVKSINEVSNTLNQAYGAGDRVLKGVIDYSTQAELLSQSTTGTTQETLASTELASSKTAEAAAHTANATAIGAETGAMTGLATSQAAATASALALYAATKKAAAASIFAAHAYIPFAGVGIASGFVAEMEGVLAAIGAFANGGIVGGTSYSGDKILTRLNSGEMVLNRTQQGNLFNLLNNGIGGTGQVEFKIKGQELVGVLNNYNNKFNKVK